MALVHPGPSAATVAVALLFMVWLAGGHPPVDRFALVAAMLLCQQVAISLHNDWCDRALDAAAKPWRAIPSGAAPAGRVRAAAWLLAAFSLGFAAAINRRETLLDVVGIGAGFAYNARLKRTAWSWLPFAIAFPLLPVFGGVALPMLHAPPSWLFVSYAIGVPAAVAIHLADTIRDLDADAAFGVQGLAHRLGVRRARALRTALALLAALVAGYWLLGGPLAAPSSDSASNSAMSRTGSASNLPWVRAASSSIIMQ